MSKTLKYILIGVAFLLVIAGIGKKIGFIGKETKTLVTIEKVLTRNITEVVSASGKIQPEVEVKISPDVSGEIVELLVSEGQQVNKGQLLCKINPQIYMSNRDKMEALLNSSRANMSNANARFAQAQANFTNIESTYFRNKKLFEQGAIAQADMDNSSAQLNAAKADLEGLKQNIKAAEFNIANAQASLKEANENLERTTILSPVNGKISKLNIEVGERVVGTSQMAGTELMRIANLNEMEVLVDVNENDIVKVHLNDSVNIEVDAYLGKIFLGQVTEIANSASNLNSIAGADQVTNFQVKIRIAHESYLHLITIINPAPFRPGMTATVEIKTKTEKNVIAVPIQCVTQCSDTVTQKKYNSKTTNIGSENEPMQIVFINKDGNAIAKSVKVGIMDNNYIQVTDGIRMGEEVITAPYKAITKKLKNGTKVKIVSKDDLPHELEKEED